MVLKSDVEFVAEGAKWKVHSRTKCSHFWVQSDEESSYADRRSIENSVLAFHPLLKQIFEVNLSQYITNIASTWQALVFFLDFHLCGFSVLDLSVTKLLWPEGDGKCSLFDVEYKLDAKVWLSENVADTRRQIKLQFSNCRNREHGTPPDGQELRRANWN